MNIAFTCNLHVYLIHKKCKPDFVPLNCSSIFNASNSNSVDCSCTQRLFIVFHHLDHGSSITFSQGPKAWKEAVHKVRHAIFGQFCPPPPIPLCPTTPGPPENTAPTPGPPPPDF